MLQLSDILSQTAGDVNISPPDRPAPPAVPAATPMSAIRSNPLYYSPSPNKAALQLAEDTTLLNTGGSSEIAAGAASLVASLALPTGGWPTTAGTPSRHYMASAAEASSWAAGATPGGQSTLSNPLFAPDSAQTGSGTAPSLPAGYGLSPGASDVARGDRAQASGQYHSQGAVSSVSSLTTASHAVSLRRNILFDDAVSAQQTSWYVRCNTNSLTQSCCLVVPA
jgi:hypothetical protein